MDKIKITGEPRNLLGKKESKKIRKTGVVPCVVYGGEKNIHFSADVKTFKPLIFSPSAFIVELGVEDFNCMAILKDIQYHPVSDEIIHIDFLQVFEEKPIIISIPVALTGTSIGVREGGKLQLINRRLKVKGLIENLPNTLEVDITNLKLGGTIKIRDLKFENLDLLDPKNAVVAAVKLTRVAKSTVGAAE